MPRVLLDVATEDFPGGIGRFSKIRRRFPASLFGLEQAVPNESGHQPFKGRLHRACHLERRGSEENSGSYAHLAQSAGQLRGRQIVGRAECGLQFEVPRTARTPSNAPWAAV